MRKTNTVRNLLAVSLFMIFLGACLGQVYHTSNGAVKVTDVSFVTTDGAVLRGLLYVPKSADPATPLPAVVGAHGYNNTAEIQGLNAIELSRRGIVVFTVDEYGHGNSSFPDEKINKGIASDNGIYAALQYLKNVPYVDTNNVGLVGHSMGGSSIQLAAIKAWTLHESDSSIIVPKAVLPTSQSFMLNADGTPLLGKYPVNIGSVYGQFDEWAKGMWGVDKGSDINTTDRAKSVMGFAMPEYNKLYQYGINQPISKDEAVAAATMGELRAIYQLPVVHPRIHMSSTAGQYIIDFFDITLLGGKSPLANTDQIWWKKELFTGVSLIGFFIFVVTFGLTLLRTSFFSTIIQKEPVSPSNPKTASQKAFYWVIYVACLLPAPLLWNLVNGYAIDIKSMGRAVKTLFPANPIFPMPTANGLVLFNLAIGTITLLVFVLTYKLYMKKNGITFANLGVAISRNNILKSFLLAFIVLIAGYGLIAAIEYLFLVDMRWYVLSIKTITVPKIRMFLVYMPFWIYAFVISSLALNSFTRIQDSKEWVNIVLMMVASVGGLLVFWAIDYGTLLNSGIKWITTVPYPAGTTSALSGVLLWGVLFILPVSAVISRIFFKATGSIWVGGFINALIITLFAISNTVVSAGIL